MAYIYFNPNPSKRINKGDCTVRAIAKALNISWDTAYIDLVMQGYLLKDMPSSNEVMNSYLRSKRFSKRTIPDLCPDCYSFEDFSNDYQDGTYVVGTGTHVAAIVDGVIYDAWNSSDCVPIYYYKKEIEEW